MEWIRKTKYPCVPISISYNRISRIHSVAANTFKIPTKTRTRTERGSQDDDASVKVYHRGKNIEDVLAQTSSMRSI